MVVPASPRTWEADTGQSYTVRRCFKKQTKTPGSIHTTWVLCTELHLWPFINYVKARILLGNSSYSAQEEEAQVVCDSWDRLFENTVKVWFRNSSAHNLVLGNIKKTTPPKFILHPWVIPPTPRPILPRGLLTVELQAAWGVLGIKLRSPGRTALSCGALAPAGDG